MCVYVFVKGTTSRSYGREVSGGEETESFPRRYWSLSREKGLGCSRTAQCMGEYCVSSESYRRRFRFERLKESGMAIN